MPRWNGRPDIVIIRNSRPMPPKATRGPDVIKRKPRTPNEVDKHKREVTACAFAAWQRGDYGDPFRRNGLRDVAGKYIEEFCGLSIKESPLSDGVYYEHSLENLMRRIRAMLPEED